MDYRQVLKIVHDAGGPAWNHNQVQAALCEVIYPLRPWRRFSVDWTMDLVLGVLEVLDSRHPRG